MLLPFAVLIFAATFIGFGVVDAHAEEVASLVCSKHAIAGAKPYGRSVSFSQENETFRRVHSQNNKYKNVHWTLDKSSDPWKFIGTPEIGIWRFELEQFEPQWFTGEAINKEGARVRSCDLTFPVARPVLEERNSPQKQKSSDHARDVIGSKSSAEPAQALSGTKTIERLEEAGPPIIDTVPAYWRKAGLFIGKAIFKFVRSEKYVEKEWVEKNNKLKFRTFAGTEEKLDGKVALYVEGSMKFDCNDRSYVAVHWRGRNVQKKAISYGCQPLTTAE